MNASNPDPGLTAPSDVAVDQAGEELDDGLAFVLFKRDELTKLLQIVTYVKEHVEGGTLAAPDLVTVEVLDDIIHNCTRVLRKAGWL